MDLTQLELDNLVLAKFMGFEPTHPNLIEGAWNRIRYPVRDKVFDESMYVSDCTSTSSEGRYETFNITQGISLSKLKFHKSWDWIMPVVLKIESFHVNFIPLYKVEILEHRCRIIDVYYKKIVFSSRELGFKKIDNLFTVCVQFVNMWNELNKIL